MIMKHRYILHAGLWLLIVLAVTPSLHAQRLIPTCTPNESWIPVGVGVGGSVAAATDANGSLCVIHEVPMVWRSSD